MTGIVPDVNSEGLVLALVRRLTRSDLAEWWFDLRITVHSFRDLGWAADLSDREVWNRCQASGLVLITDNRNRDDPDSLEATLRDSVRADSLPVVTISDKGALRNDRAYAGQVALDLLELLSDLRDFGRYLGVGRIFLPISRRAATDS